MVRRVSRRLAVLLVSFAFAACSSPHGGIVPQTPGSGTPATASGAMHPHNGAGALPGNGAGALPGATLPCSVSATQGEASCTIAINVNVPPLNDPTQPASLIPGLHPADLQSAYGFRASGAGGTVAVVDAYDDPSAESDLAVYRNAFGLPPCGSSDGCFRKLNQAGTAGSYPPTVDPGWSQEVALDLAMVSAVCPNCKILLVEANSPNVDDLGASVDTAVARGAHAIGNSYYAPEWSGESSEDAHYHHPGVAVTVSAGDQASPFYPAASPYVTAVGGTSLQRNGSAWDETPWTYGGQGCSAYEPRPSFQAGVPCKTRATVDVSAVADPQTGVAIYSTAAGGWVVAGGTSVGAPLIAAAYALAGNAPGPAYSYAHRSAFHDIAPAGYDLPTGLGSPRGVAGL